MTTEPPDPGSPMGAREFRRGLSEAGLVEGPAIQTFAGLGWKVTDLWGEWAGGRSSEGRESRREVILPDRLRAALERLNPDLPALAIEAAIEQLTRDRSKMLPVEANRELYDLLKAGVKATFQGEDGCQATERVRVINWREPKANEFVLGSQVWVSGDLYQRRCDLVGFVNGIPLVLVELKGPHRHLKDAYDDNLSDYRGAIPRLFIPNAVVILSNGGETRVGSTTAEWEHFVQWKRINDEGEEGVVSLETVIRGVCEPGRLLDIVENFTAFRQERGDLIKVVVKNHQYLGVNRAIQEVHRLGDNRGRLGVFWHTQGSGKSLSMVFFCQKILRTVPGNWTFLVVTDRDELDGQIYKTFARSGVVSEPEERCHARSGQHLQELLREDHRCLFTLIQKFRTRQGERYPTLSERDDIIVITDEAHRSQYDVFALNMRNALPNAAFIGFTGTPLMAGEEKTREVFGDYVSVYNFAQSIEDGATVPLYYENRIPELQLTNEALNEEMERLLEEAELDEEQEKKLEREFAREYHLITREERLETVARDIVRHFTGRGYRGKGMVICIDKATAVRMHDKVKEHWDVHLAELRARLATADEAEREVLESQIEYVASTDMAVVVSQSQNEVTELGRKGLDIVPHRRRMNTENLDEKFKSPEDPLRIVFVCAMWITGFDVPTCSTIYLDKPMRNHTLMQTIARANRVAPGKTAGFIVDYVGVFRDLQKALAIYAAPSGREGGQPIKDKADLVEQLKGAIEEVTAWCQQRGIELRAVIRAVGFERVRLIEDAVEVIVAGDEPKRAFLQRAAHVAKLYKAILPDPAASEMAPSAILLAFLAQKLRSLTPPADISAIMDDVEDLLDQSIAARGYVIRADEADAPPLVDLRELDVEALQARFAASRKHIEGEKLKGQIDRKLREMVRLNRLRVDFLERFQRLIDDYNSGSKNIEEFFEELIRFAQGLNEEEKRGIAEGLTEEELALFDILTKPDPKLTRKEEAEVKKVCKALLETLKGEKLVLDWRNRQQSRAAVRLCIEKALDQLPAAYDQDLWRRKCDLAYQHVFESYADVSHSAYARPPEHA